MAKHNIVLPLAASILMFSSHSVAEEFRGAGGATFGMSAAEVKQHYAKLTPAAGTASEVAFYDAGEKQSFEGFENCTTTLVFLANRLVQISYICPPLDALPSALAEKLGKPTKACGEGVKEQEWIGEQTTVYADCKNKGISIADNALRKELEEHVSSKKLQAKKQREEAMKARAAKKAAAAKKEKSAN